MTLDPVSLTPVSSAGFSAEEPTQKTLLPDDEIPHLGHAILFFVMCVPLLFAGEGVFLFLAKQVPQLHSKSYRELFSLMSQDARLAIPTQAFVYLLIGFVTMVVFTVLWQRPFFEGIHWNASTAHDRLWGLCGLGVGLGISITFLQAYLPIPMPQNPPILQDMVHSSLGAWMMLFFGVSIAPFMEELAFRGFLLPGLVHAFQWLMRQQVLSPQAFSWITLPLSVVLTTVPFALLHAEQVSSAWGPLLLIGLVSIALCAVRLRLRSLAASTVVHAAYNLTLFAGILLQTDGFQHLERLNS
jgi:membrane protease YdiL (CAAX protease family)